MSSTPQTYQNFRIHPLAVTGNAVSPNVAIYLSVTDTGRSARVNKATIDEPLAEVKAAKKHDVTRFRGLQPQIEAAHVAARKAEAAITAAKAHLEFVEAEAGISAEYLAQRAAALKAIADAEAAAEKAAKDAAHIRQHGPHAWDSAHTAIRIAVNAAKRERQPEAERQADDLRARIEAKLTEMAPLFDEYLTALFIRDTMADDPPKAQFEALVDSLIGHKPFVPAIPKPSNTTQAIPANPAIRQIGV